MELELVGSPQLSLEPTASLVVGVERLQVEELSEWLAVSAAELVVFSVEVSGAMMALDATLPGVIVGSSVGSFICAVPFHALPGTNSGIPKLSSSVELLVLTGLSPLESGQPEFP